MPRKRNMETVGDWIELVSLVPPELAASSPPLQHLYGKLRDTLAEVQGLVVERDFHQAQKQEASVKIKRLLESGARTASTVRAILREHFGPRSEKLAAFKMQPFRGRKRARKDGEPGNGAKE
jgi:hypothetical protein